MRAITNLVVSFLWAALLFISPSLVSADQAQYIYDDLGRLSQVIDGQGNVATYTYDAVGNLLSITRGEEKGTGWILTEVRAGYGFEWLTKEL